MIVYDDEEDVVVNDPISQGRIGTSLEYAAYTIDSRNLTARFGKVIFLFEAHGRIYNSYS